MGLSELLLILSEPFLKGLFLPLEDRKSNLRRATLG